MDEDGLEDHEARNTSERTTCSPNLMQKGSSGRVLRRWLLWPLLFLLVMAVAVLIVGRLQGNELAEEANRLWASVEREIAKYPDRGSVDIGFTTPFPDEAAFEAWAMSPAGSRVPVEHDGPGSAEPFPLWTHMEVLEQWMEGARWTPSILKCIQRSSQEFRRSGLLLHAHSSAVLAGWVLDAVEEGYLPSASLRNLDILPSLDDLRLVYLVEAVAMVEFMEREIRAHLAGRWPAAFLDDDWDRMRIVLARRALAAVDATDWDSLHVSFQALENEYPEDVKNPGFWNIFAHDHLFLGLVMGRYARGIEALARITERWEELSASAE